MSKIYNSMVITGGSRGIGRDITKAFLEAGYKVIVGARTKGDIKDLDSKNLIFHPMDVRDESAHKELADIAINVTGRLDVWINNAGLSAWKPIESIDEDFFDELMGVNLKGAFWGCKVAAEAMKKNGGTIINISSLAGKRGSTNNSMYCATKFGMNGLTQSLAKELGPQGIRVNALCPVLIKTEGLLEALKSDYSPAKGDPNNFIENFSASNSALGGLPSGGDVGQMALFLASKRNNAVTGQCINIDCGVFPQ
jgi:NAD(P)-dependent dehydrogenase (short-subunit alcohol dehydrogenase family)